ncbi:uncharacterized protein F5891DRAFT_1128625 [Suillus fuscotomentosus]|uniref:CxC1-like cysteine cluster associated with KDZ transposases domain-containing protein n=1 Tax=Suillus fuscotomentosus TaxID=1912939 RepID=A0AAD4HJQ1_9AGAM|nr:uncharacterized protein F5891DRAFT_1128625 [Suillus fuscotomentosus]KAG1900180.1 hypothetical protein F5891DRAFT_1128625 [Suillus fuscotomentosus]
MYPTIAISLRTLAAFRQCHRACPRFSIQAQCRTLCFLHDIPYRPYLNTQFSAAYDIYLEIIHHVDQRLKAALKHDTPNWRLLNSCPACFYKLQDEPTLDFNWLVCVDGNNSLKRWDSSIYGNTAWLDSRQARSDYWIDRETVDKYKHEAKSCDINSHDDNWEEEPVDASTNPSNVLTCVDRWCNAGPETRKKMFSVFHESGIFIAACRHRFILLACDMVQSGELAKYPLALIDKLLTVYGKNGGCAYDIGCAFSKTLSNSSFGSRAHDLGFRMMVGSFHGHAHNHKCQLRWHPMYIPGMGHTEGEGCEHIFSASNELARSTRHASSFHRHQSIKEHFSFWDQDKYASLSNFLWNHYREALKAVHNLTTELTAIKHELRLTDDDFVRFLDEEQKYLDDLKQPPAEDRIRIRYVETLDELAERRSDWDSARQAANNALTELPASSLVQINQALTVARIRVDSSYAKLQHAEALVAHMESQLGVDARWEIGGEEYSCFKEEASLGKYRAALNDLERLVVMRLFELSKLSLSGTGYKLRQQISKALQRRSEAICKAIARYNVQAVALNPPCDKISWKDIADYTFLGEFDLLQHSRSDVRSDDWAKPAYREETSKYFKLLRAREEITRLNVEIRRLRTAIYDEELQATAVIRDLSGSDPLLASELKRQWRSRAAINAVHVYRLDQIGSLTGFSGVRGREDIDDIQAIIMSDYVDMDAIDREEFGRATEDIADYLQSIVD